MDDDFDIYGDLPESCNIQDNAECIEQNEDLSKAQEELKKEVTELTSQLQSLKKINATLEVNLSSLLKTAKAEIARKDKIIDELRKQVDNMSFRRGHFNRNTREINNKSSQQMSNVEEVNNIQSADEHLTSENASLVETKFNSNQSNEDQDVSNYKRFSNRYHDTKYHSTNSKESFKPSTTIFTKRLRQRIIEEEEAEQKRKLEIKEKENIIEENNHENNKEINIDDKENQSQFSIWNSNVGYKGIEHNYAVNSNNAEENVVCTVNQQKSTLSIKSSEKRIDHDTDMPTRKRRKLEVEQNGREDDKFSEYDREVTSNIKKDKLDYKDNSNAYIERLDTHCTSQYDREHSRSRSRSNDVSYKRKEHYKKFRNDHNYSKEVAYYHEKDKYSRSRNRSPVQKYSDVKHKYRDDRYRDHRDRFDRRNFHDKSEDASITSNKRSYDLRNKDKHRSNGKYNITEFNSPRHKGSRYSDSRVSRSISHERSKSSSRERTNHKTYDKRSSKSTKNYNCLEAPTPRKKESTLEKPSTIEDTSTIEDGEIVDTSPIKANTNMENKETKNIEESIDVDNFNQLEKKVVSSKSADELITSSYTSVKEEEDKNIEDEKTEDNIQSKKNEDTNVNLTNNVNINSNLVNSLIESKQDCIVTSTVIINDKDSKCDEQIVHHAADVETVNTCDNTQKLLKEDMDSVKEIVGNDKHESNTDCTTNIKTEEKNVFNNVDIVYTNTSSNEISTKEGNASENKPVLSKKNLESQTLASNDLQELPTVKPLHQKEEDNNESERVKPKECESKKESSERKNPGIIVLARRRKRVQLGDTNASMTIVINANDTKSDADLKNNTENNSKSRACKVSRSYNDVL